MEPLVLLHHIPKTGGTALRQLTTANYGPKELINLDKAAAVEMRPDLDLDRVAQQCRDYYRSLTPARRAELGCVAGYTAPFLLSSVTDRPARAFCMLRDPVDLVVSHYLFMVWRADHVEGTEQHVLQEMRERGWELKDVYRELGGGAPSSSDLHRLFMPLFNGQTRHILLSRFEHREMPYGAEGEGLEEHRVSAFATLSDHYVVGTQDRFSQSVRLFADSFGWRTVYVPRANTGPLRSRDGGSEIDDETRSLIRSYNAIDAELHAHYSQRLSTMPATDRLTSLQGHARRRARRAASRLRRRMGGVRG